MTAIYNQVYKVPVWVIVNITDEAKVEAFRNYLAGNGAIEQGWPSDSFSTTIKKMWTKGWHEHKKEIPYTIDSSFATNAIAEHVRQFFGPSKMMNLSPTKPWHQIIDRSIRTEDDYRTIFNDLLFLQDGITLSQLFDIGNKCHTGERKTKVFFTFGDIRKNQLQVISDNVIVVGANGDVPDSEDVLHELDSKLDSILGQ